MSTGRVMSEFTRLEYPGEAAILRDQALMRNAVLRRALALLAHEHVLVLAEKRPQLLADPEAGTAVMLCAVMAACEAVEKEVGR